MLNFEKAVAHDGIASGATNNMYLKYVKYIERKSIGTNIVHIL